MKYYAHIWLDDWRSPDVPDMYRETVAWVKDYESFVEQVKVFGDKIGQCKVYFDHDLGMGKSGYDCAKFLVEWCMEKGYDVPDYDIQSANPIGRKNIESVFETYWKVFFDNV